MLSHDERDRLAQLSAVVGAQDPLFAQSMGVGRPRLPFEYRAARRRLLCLTAAGMLLLAAGVLLSSRPDLMAVSVSAGLVCWLATAVGPRFLDVAPRHPRGDLR